MVMLDIRSKMVVMVNNPVAWIAVTIPLTCREVEQKWCPQEAEGKHYLAIPPHQRYGQAPSHRTDPSPWWGSAYCTRCGGPPRCS